MAGASEPGAAAAVGAATAVGADRQETRVTAAASGRRRWIGMVMSLPSEAD